MLFSSRGCILLIHGSPACGELLGVNWERGQKGGAGGGARRGAGGAATANLAEGSPGGGARRRLQDAQSFALALELGEAGGGVGRRDHDLVEHARLVVGGAAELPDFRSQVLVHPPAPQASPSLLQKQCSIRGLSYPRDNTRMQSSRENVLLLATKLCCAEVVTRGKPVVSPLLRDRSTTHCFDMRKGLQRGVAVANPQVSS